MPRPKKQHLKQRKDGRFCAVYNGKQFMGMTEDEALAKRDEYKRQLEEEEYIGKRPTVKQYASTWLKLHKAGVSDKCYNDYAKQLEALFPFIGDKRLDKVTVDDAASVWEHFSGYSASTIHRARMLYVSLFDTAFENGMVKKNPFRMKYAQPPKAPSGSHRALEKEEIDLIWKTPHRMQLAALVMLYCGLRRGEVLALTADDIDTKNKLLSVNKAVRFVGNKAVITVPKTAAGIRIVPIPDIVSPFFDDFAGDILQTAKGGPMTETAFSRAWESYIRQLSINAGHPVNIRPHDLRHTYCTMIADAGVSIKQAMQWMGHADEKMILHIYDHVTATRIQTSTEKLNSALLNMQTDMQKL